MSELDDDTHQESSQEYIVNGGAEGFIWDSIPEISKRDSEMSYSRSRAVSLAGQIMKSFASRSHSVSVDEEHETVFNHSSVSRPHSVSLMEEGSMSTKHYRRIAGRIRAASLDEEEEMEESRSRSESLAEENRTRLRSLKEKIEGLTPSTPPPLSLGLNNKLNKLQRLNMLQRLNQAVAKHRTWYDMVSRCIWWKVKALQSMRIKDHEESTKLHQSEMMKLDARISELSTVVAGVRMKSKNNANAAQKHMRELEVARGQCVRGIHAHILRELLFQLWNGMVLNWVGYKAHVNGETSSTRDEIITLEGMSTEDAALKFAEMSPNDRGRALQSMSPEQRAMSLLSMSAEEKEVALESLSSSDKASMTLKTIEQQRNLACMSPDGAAQLLASMPNIERKAALHAMLCDKRIKTLAAMSLEERRSALSEMSPADKLTTLEEMSPQEKADALLSMSAIEKKGAFRIMLPTDIAVALAAMNSRDKQKALAAMSPFDKKTMEEVVRKYKKLASLLMRRVVETSLLRLHAQAIHEWLLNKARSMNEVRSMKMHLQTKAEHEADHIEFSLEIQRRALRSMARSICGIERSKALCTFTLLQLNLRDSKVKDVKLQQEKLMKDAELRLKECNMAHTVELANLQSVHAVQLKEKSLDWQQQLEAREKNITVQTVELALLKASHQEAMSATFEEHAVKVAGLQADAVHAKIEFEAWKHQFEEEVQKTARSKAALYTRLSYTVLKLVFWKTLSNRFSEVVTFWRVNCDLDLMRKEHDAKVLEILNCL